MYFELLLANPNQVKALHGRKSDKRDCERMLNSCIAVRVGDPHGLLQNLDPRHCCVNAQICWDRGAEKAFLDGLRPGDRHCGNHTVMHRTADKTLIIERQITQNTDSWR